MQFYQTVMGCDWPLAIAATLFFEIRKMENRFQLDERNYKYQTADISNCQSIAQRKSIRQFIFIESNILQFNWKVHYRQRKKVSNKKNKFTENSKK